ncbi:MAG TPA: triphosphoribosyl-dephospho-CoA synthase, partial [Pirellulaceae bacterium]|nr:triphosphoribosyl-dephospho-CoA synthase [Pirellulaceae bacterium]
VAMRAASERDLVARQYVETFSLVLDTLVPRLCAARELGLTLPQAIVHTQIQTMAELPDSLIARKCGAEVADQAKFIARQVLEFAPPGTDDWGRALADFDFWLRSDGHRRNPGTTADLIAAALFAGLRDGLLARA